MQAMRPLTLFFCSILMLTACQSGDKQPAEAAEAPPVLTFSTDTVIIKGQAMPTVTLNGVEWLAQNLTVETADSWCYENDPGLCRQYGRLYRWAAARDACRSLGAGWRLPSDAEWQALAEKAGGYVDYLTEQAAGDPMQGNAMLQESAFRALLVGFRGSGGGFSRRDNTGFYWSGTAVEDQAWFYILNPTPAGRLTRRKGSQRLGMACRCVQSAEEEAHEQ